MPGTQTSAIPFTVYQTPGVGVSSPVINHAPEAASKTFHIGVPVVLSSGNLQESGAISTAVTILGFSAEAGHNLGTAGTAPVGGSGLTYGSVQNQTSAVNIPIGAPMADGTCMYFVGNNLTLFQGVTDAAHALIGTDVGSIFGLTKDTGTGQWFVDTTITTANGGAILEVVALIDAVGVLGGKVAFRVTNAGQTLGI